MPIQSFIAYYFNFDFTFRLTGGTLWQEEVLNKYLLVQVLRSKFIINNKFKRTLRPHALSSSYDMEVYVYLLQHNTFL